MYRINLVMIVKNEEKNIARCILSVRSIINKIIVIDTGSTDKTKEIALELGAVIYDYKWNNDFSKARNYGIKKSDAEWNLILDADEYITKIDVKKIKEFISSNKNIIGQIKIINLFEQEKEIKKSSVYLSRLAPKGIYFEGAIHEQLGLNLPRKVVDIEVEHDGYLNTNKFDRNISLIIKELEKDNNDIYMNYQAAKTYYTNKMYSKAQLHFEKFYQLFDIEKDIFAKEGIVLYIYNTIQSSNFELGLKLIDECFDIMNDYSDFYFVCGVFFTELVAYDINKYIQYLDNIEYSYLNALQIGENSSSIESVAGTGSYLAAFNLGIFYELNGDMKNAYNYYKLSSNYGYSKAIDRMKFLQNNLNK